MRVAAAAGLTPNLAAKKKVARCRRIPNRRSFTTPLLPLPRRPSHDAAHNDDLRDLPAAGADARPVRRPRRRRAQSPREGSRTGHPERRSTAVDAGDTHDHDYYDDSTRDDDDGHAAAGPVVQQHERAARPRHGRPRRVVPRAGRLGAAVQDVLQGGRLPHHRGGAQERPGREARGRRGAGTRRRPGERVAQDLQAATQLQHVVARHDAAALPRQRAAADARPRRVPQLAAAAGGPLLLRVREEDAPRSRHHVGGAAAALPQGHIRAVARPAARLRRGPHQGRRRARERRLAQPLQGRPGRRPPRPARHRRLDALQPRRPRGRLRHDLCPARPGHTRQAGRRVLDEARGALQADGCLGRGRRGRTAEAAVRPCRACRGVSRSAVDDDCNCTMDKGKEGVKCNNTISEKGVMRSIGCKHYYLGPAAPNFGRRILVPRHTHLHARASLGDSIGPSRASLP